MKTGRNEPCPCGSGKKFKKCCEGKADASQKMRSRGLVAVLLVVLAIVIAAVVIDLRSEDAPAVETERVWSPEHGHYHDVR
jgi:hypothetical protein